MSSEGSDLKAGHPPAVKAGGMRVVSKHKASDKPDSDAYDQKYLDQLPQQSNISAPVSAPPVQAKGYQDSKPEPPQAVKMSHTKPLPTVEKSHIQPKKQMQINQPRKI